MVKADFAAFRRQVIAGIESDLAQEAACEQALKAEVLPRIREAVARARQDTRCRRAWLFGSFAWGRPTAGSDVDLLVEGCPDPDGLTADLWRALDRAVHVVQLKPPPPQGGGFVSAPQGA